MKPSKDTEHHWAAAQIAAGNAETCLHFGMYKTAAVFANRAQQHRTQIDWTRHEDTDETGFDV